MEKEKKWMILGMVATIFCLAVAITCAALCKFNLVSDILLGFIVVFSIVIAFFIWKDMMPKTEEEQPAEEKTEEQPAAEQQEKVEEAKSEEVAEEKAEKPARKRVAKNK